MSFYQQIAPYYHYIFKINQAQVNFIKDFVHDKNALMVDMGCGIGTLSFELNNFYKQVVGVDLDSAMIHVATNKKEMEHSTVEFLQAGMLNLIDILRPKSVDGLICFGNTLVHLNSLDEVTQFIQQSKTVLKKDGMLLIQLVNYDRILSKDISSLPTVENDELIFERRYTYQQDVKKIDFNTKLMVKSNGSIIENSVELLPVLQKQMESILLNCGFEQLQFFGNFTKEAFNSSESTALIVAAKVG